MMKYLITLLILHVMLFAQVSNGNKAGPEYLTNTTSHEFYTVVHNTQETWNFRRYLPYKVITIKEGAQLTITADLFLDEYAKIIVERKGKLIVDGGRITCSCGLWKGIEVWGDPTKSSDVNNQGLVWIMNGGTIENAACGIRAVKMALPDGGGGQGEIAHLDYSGGLVWANGAEFINNKEAVRFYKYPATGYTFPNKSFFWGIRFETNDNYIGSSHPEYFVNLSDINKVNFLGCEFINNTAQQNFQTGGIYSYNSQFYVEGNQSGSTWDNNLFSNMQYGIYAIASNPNRFADIRHCDFDNNFRGVFINGMSNAVVVANNFKINSPFSQSNGGYGLYLDHSTGYKIEENNFSHVGHPPTGVGLVVNQSGGQTNQVYRNWFTNLACGMDIQGENRSNTSGLVLKCNQYEGTVMDKIITWDELKITKAAGIAASQGSSSSNPEAMAGNLFQIDNSGNDDDILNEANHITYYYPSNYGPGFSRVRPIDFTENTVTPQEEDFEPQWTFENGCPPEEAGGGGSSEEELRGNISQSNLTIDSTENLLAMLIDGGNTEMTQTDVETSVPLETIQVYNDLMNKSPYLSDTVMSTAIEKEDVLPGAMIRDIMVANPNSAKSEALINKLDNRWDPLPEYMKAQILQGRSIVSIREETESVLSARKLEKATYFNALVRFYLEDTLNPQASNDSLEVLLQQENSLNAKYRLALLGLEHGAWSEGLGILNSIPAQFELTVSETNDHQQFTALYNLLSDIAQQGKTVLEADSTAIVSLVEIEEGNSGQASAYARNILLALNQMEYEEPILLPDMLKSAIAQEEYNTLINKANGAPGYLSIKPNPAKDYIIVEYKLVQETGASIDITDITGNLKTYLNVSNWQDQVIVNTQDWKPGIYIAALKINGKLIESVKFTITD